MRRGLAVMALGCALSAGAAHAASVEVREAAVRLTVIAEARSDVKVEVVRSNPRLPVTVRTGRGGNVLIDGGLERRLRGCRTVGGRPGALVAGLGEVGWDDLPQLVIRTPRDVRVAAGGAVYGDIGRARSLDLSSAGCGDWTIGNVEARLRLTHAGSGDVKAGTAGAAELRIAGSGDVVTAPVNGPARVDIAGSGTVRIAALEGPFEAHVAGSGDVIVLAGRASSVKVSIVGSGDVEFRGVAQTLTARIAGSGDVRAQHVTGEVRKQILGSGAVRIGQGGAGRPRG